MLENAFIKKRPGAARKLPSEHEFLSTTMRLKVGLLTENLAYRFDTVASQVTSIFVSWILSMAKGLKGLIIWAGSDVIRRNLPDSFRKDYPKCRVTIDCTEVFIETPSSLELAAFCWSNYTHHYTIKFLAEVTPNGAISFLSGCYGGRATDIFITEDSKFVKQLIPGDQVIADSGF